MMAGLGLPLRVEMLRRIGLLLTGLFLLLPAATASASTQRDVSIVNFSFSPTPLSAAIGDFVVFTNTTTTTQHTSTADLLGLWDSGHILPGKTFTVNFDHAGTFAYHCAIHTFMKGSVSVPLRVSPSSGPLSTTFTITVADQPAPAGMTQDIQKRRVGGTWKTWRSTTGMSTTFKPTKTSTFQFRARLRRTSDNVATGWSPVASASVT
jgi:plastocyanin